MLSLAVGSLSFTAGPALAPNAAVRSPVVNMADSAVVIGVAAVQRFRWIILVFAAILLLSSVKLLLDDDSPEDLSNNTVMRISKWAVGAVDEYDGDRFFTTIGVESGDSARVGRRVATPLLLCLVCIELSDFVFAVDSIPAVIGVTTDGFIVYSSNIFAIMGLRSLYTLVAHAVNDLPYLKPAVALVLGACALRSQRRKRRRRGRQRQRGSCGRRRTNCEICRDSTRRAWAWRRRRCNSWTRGLPWQRSWQTLVLGSRAPRSSCRTLP